MIMRVAVAQTLLLPWEDQRQMATLVNLYPATKPWDYQWLRHYCCLGKIRDTWLLWWPYTQQPSQVSSTYKRNKWFTPMCRCWRIPNSRKFGLHRKGATKSLSLTLQSKPSTTPTPTEPFGEVIHQYTNTLCTTQKQTNLTNSLQDIAAFNEYVSAKFKDWLIDIETAADLICQSQIKSINSYICHGSNQLW